MKNKKIFVPVQTFKNLVSEDTLRILQVLDKHNLTSDQLSTITKIPRNRLQSQLQRLSDGKLIKTKKQNDRDHYSLSFKGSSLLHPENSRIMVLFSASIITLLLSIGSMIHWISQTFLPPENETNLLQEADNVVKGPLSVFATETTQNVQDPWYSIIALIGITLFVVLISVTMWRYQKNKSLAL